jgi:hypothetical protein
LPISLEALAQWKRPLLSEGSSDAEEGKKRRSEILTLER